MCGFRKKLLIFSAQLARFYIIAKRYYFFIRKLQQKKNIFHASKICGNDLFANAMWESKNRGDESVLLYLYVARKRNVKKSEIEFLMKRANIIAMYFTARNTRTVRLAVRFTIKSRI